MSAAAPLTIGEKVSGVPRSDRWMYGVLLPCLFPIICLGVAYGLVNQTDPAFFSRLPWRLPLLISWGVYMTLVSSISSYVRLFLPHTPVAVDDAVQYVGLGAVRLSLGVVQAFVFGLVKINRVVMAFTCVFAVFTAGVVVFWVWMVRR